MVSGCQMNPTVVRTIKYSSLLKFSDFVLNFVISQYDVIEPSTTLGARVYPPTVHYLLRTKIPVWVKR